MVAKARWSGVAALACSSAKALVGLVVISATISVGVGPADVRVLRRLALLAGEAGPRGDEVRGVRRHHAAAVLHRVHDLLLGLPNGLLEVVDALLGLVDHALDGLGGVVVGRRVLDLAAEGARHVDRGGDGAESDR